MSANKRNGRRRLGNGRIAEALQNACRIESLESRVLLSTVLSETFEGAFPEDNGWSVGDSNAAGTTAYWNDVYTTFGGEGTHGGSWKGYCAGTGYAGTVDTPLYQDDMTSYMSKSINLSGATAANLDFWYKIPSIESGWDYARVYIDSSVVWQASSSVTAWTNQSINLNSFVGGTHTLKFEFYADVSNTAEGWYLDDITVNTSTGPANDFFAGAATIAPGTATVTGSNVGATFETGEPSHAGRTGGKSVWWNWTAPASGLAQIDTIGSSFDTTLGVYTGTSVSGLTAVAGDDDSGGNLTSLVTFNAVSGTTYRIAVDGYSGSSGNIMLHVPGSMVSNNNFANAFTLTGSTVTTAGTNVGATKETGEPNHAGSTGGKSVWWNWTAPATGPVQVDTIGSNFDTLLGVYTGTSVSALTTIAGNDDSGGNLTSLLTFNGVSGTTYRIAVDGYAGASGNITLHLMQQAVAPANNNFVNAITLTGATVTTNGTNVGANKETGEPNHAGSGGGKSVWWNWTAPSSGRVQIDTIGSNFDTLLGVYTGTSVSSLTWVAGNDDGGGNLTSLVAFDAVSGTTYRIAVDGYGGSSGNITLHVLPLGPANNNFASAITLSGATVTTTGTNLGASKETGEPNHAGYSGGKSVWWNWTAPATGAWQIDTIGSNFDTILGVYTGTSVSSLTTIAGDDDAGGSLTSLVRFNAVSGTTYRIAVDGFAGASGNITLHILPVGPVNNNFASALTLTGATVTTTGTNVGATKETGEPNHAGRTGGKSVWWNWTAPSNGTVQVDTIGSNFDTVLGVYTGTSVSSLTTIAGDDDGGGSLTSKLTFTAVAGTTYRIAVDGFAGASGNITLHILPVGPVNNNFANATVITGTTATMTGTNVGASKETGEPNHAGSTGGRSVWWSWTATASGRVQIDTIGSSFDTLLGVYTGTSVSSLTTIAGNDDGGGNLTSLVAFNAVSGTTYRIAVDGYAGASGNITLHVNLQPQTGSYDIDFTFTGLTASQQAIFQQAAQRWEQVITADVPDAPYLSGIVDDLLVDVSGEAIDGVGGILGQSAVTHYRAISRLPIRSFINFDTADIANMEANGTLLPVCIHELGHSLGIGIIWDDLNLLTGASGSDPRFTGARATAEYNAIFGVNQTSVPVENGGGGGTRLSHWRESTFGVELMTGWINGVYAPMSRVTVASLADIGYTVNMAAADPFTPSIQEAQGSADALPPTGGLLVVAPRLPARPFFGQFSSLGTAFAKKDLQWLVVGE